MVKSLEELLELAKKKEKKTMAVAVAQDNVVLEAVIKAVDMGIINAILVGNEEKIKIIAKDSNIDLSRVRII
ncbi:MAG TPA: phosphate butyryltransferase, partial [Clostridium sp.]|nr:phosphate butyryltransferase [Clostridium sp.]